MTIKMPYATRLRSALHRRPTRISEARAQLLADLASYQSKADLLDLGAMLERYSDEEAEPVRRAVDWTRAA